MATTPRWGIPYPILADAADVPQWMLNMATELDDHAKDGQGLFSARPSAATAGYGFYYFATDTAALYRSDGTTWHEVKVGQIAKADLASDVSDGFLELVTQADRRLGFGTFGTGGFGGNQFVTGSFAHGLGLTPQHIWFQAGVIDTFGGSGGTWPVIVGEVSKSSTTIAWRAAIAQAGDGSPRVSNNGVNVSWFAII